MRVFANDAPAAPSDADLVAAARRGDHAALGLLLERHRPRLFATAIRVLGYREAAEDAVQETFLSVLRHLGSLRNPEAAGAWLQTMLRRCALGLCDAVAARC